VCTDPDDRWSPSCDGGGGPPPNTPAPLPSSPVVITNPDPLDDGLVPEEPSGNAGGARGGGREDCEVPSCVDIPEFVTSPNPQFPQYQENQCLDIYIYNVCGSLITDTVVDNGSFLISAPNQIMIGTFETGQFGFGINNGLVMWLPALAFTNSANNATTFTRIGMQNSFLNSQRIAGQNVVSYRTGNIVNNIRTNVTIEYRLKNQLKVMAAWNLAPAIAAWYYFRGTRGQIGQGCTVPGTSIPC